MTLSTAFFKPNAAAALLMLALAAGAAQAQVDPDIAPIEMPWRITVTQQLLPELPRLSAIDPALIGEPSTSLRTSVWAGRERLKFGLGWDQVALAPGMRGPYAGPRSYEGSRMTIGIGWATGDRSRLEWEVPVSALQPGAAGASSSSSTTGLGERPQGTPMRLGWTIEHDGPGARPHVSLFKMELSSQTTVALRPRHGRLGLTLASRW